MSDLRKKDRLIDPSFIDKEALSVTGGGTIHVSDEVVINGIRIGDDLYECGGYIVNSRGEIQETK